MGRRMGRMAEMGMGRGQVLGRNEEGMMGKIRNGD
jgi:hypothetical protein